MSITHETWIDGDWTYVTAPEPLLAQGSLAQAVVHAQTLDETTGRPPAVQVRAYTDFYGLSARSTAGGIAGLAGIPTTAFPLLRTRDYHVLFRISARRFLPFTRTVSFLADLSFPGSFNRQDLGIVPLHRDPVIVQGRVERISGLTPVPVAGAAVTLTGIWRTPPAANVVVPPSPPDIVSLQPGLYFERTAAAGQIRRRDLNPVPGDSRMLIQDATAGATVLKVSNRTGIVAGDVLQIDGPDPDRIEFVPVHSVDLSFPADQPAVLTLEYACVRDHRPGTAVQRVTLGVPGPDNALAADTTPGDACVLTAALTGLGAPATVEIHGGPAPEYHLMTPFATVTDAGGFYRMPLLNRAGQIELRAEDGVHPAVTRVVVPDYEAVTNRVDFTLS